MVSMLLLSSEEKRPVMLSEATLKDYKEWAHKWANALEPLATFNHQATWEALDKIRALLADSLALRAEVDRLKLKVVELSRGAWVEDTAERDALRAEVARLQSDRDKWHHEFLLRDGHYDKLVGLYKESQARLAALTETIKTMIVVTKQGQPCYRTDGGIPQGMPRHIERKVRAALAALGEARG